MIDSKVTMCLCCLTAVLYGITFVECVKLKDLTDVQEGLDQVADGAKNETNYGLTSEEDGNVTKDDTYSLSTSRERKKKQDMFSRLLPMFIIPYLVQSAILPMLLMSMKAMLVKSLFVGKLAILLGLINMLRSRSNNEQNYSDHSSSNQDLMQNVVKQHYGYGGSEEYGAYIHH